MAFQSFEHTVQRGKVIALEGDEGAISTQLQLLPRASNILILPSILDCIPKPERAASFDTRTFVRKVHSTLTEQKALARSFIESPTNAQPRLALMNGGTLGARAACITQICENVTEGDMEEAEKLLESIVKEGVAGLERDIHPEGSKTVTAGGDSPKDGQPIAHIQEPTIEAMEAAECLDRRTAALQRDDDHSTIINPPEPRKVDQKIDTPKEAKSITAWVTSVAQHNGANEPRSRVRDAIKALNLEGNIVSANTTRVPEPITLTIPDAPPLTSRSLEDDDYISSDEETTHFAKERAHPVVLGEAYMVEVQSAKRSPPRRSSVRKSRSCHQLRSLFSSNPLLQQTASLDDLSILQSTKANCDTDPSSLEQLPRTTYRRNSLTDFASTPSTARPASLRIPSRMPRNRGVDVSEALQESPPFAFDSEKEVVDVLEPVFSVIEDAVIYIPGDAESLSIKAVFTAFGQYLQSSRDSPSTLPSEQSPTTPTAYDAGHVIPVSKFAITTAADIQYDLQDFDPYRPVEFDDDVPEEVPYTEPPKARNSGALVPIDTIPGLDGSKIYSLSAVESGTVVDLQCSLRALLRERFPDCEGHSNHHFFAASKADRLWNPVFSDQASSISGEEHRTVDQIIAIGCESGVSNDLLSQITGQVERLGMKRNGINQSGRLDLRYLLTSVMQTPSTGSSLIGPMSEPLLDARLLATLLVPQLEMYLATSTSVRLLLIQYPPSHLPIVLALRDLIGSKLMRVAGILDSNASEPTKIPERPINPLSNEAIIARIERLKKTNGDKKDYLKELLAQPLPPLPDAARSRPTSTAGTVSFSKANYLLPSTGTDLEIKHFLESVLKSLLDRSSWYTPETEPESPPPTAPLPPLPSLPPTPTLRKPPPRTSSQPPLSFKHPKAINPSALNALIANSPALRKHNYAPSIASSILTTTTTATERSRRRVRKLERDWENFYIGSEDEDDDDYDRMVMGRRGARIVPFERPSSGEFVKQQPPTKKALRWLGLA